MTMRNRAAKRASQDRAALRAEIRAAVATHPAVGWTPYGAINKVLRKHGRKPMRTAEQSDRLAEQRRPRAHPNDRDLTPMMAALERRYLLAVHGPKRILGTRCTTRLRLAEYDSARHLVLLRAVESTMWNETKAPQTLAYLGGRDELGLWTVRVPGTCTTVQQAWEWMVPAAVRRALAEGGDMVSRGPWWAVRARRHGAVPSELANWQHATWMAVPIAFGCGYRLEHRPPTDGVMTRSVRLYPPLTVPWPATFHRRRDLGPMFSHNQKLRY